MTSSKSSKSTDYSKEIAWFVTHRKSDVQAVIRNYKKLTRGRRGEFGIGAALFVSALEAELKSKAKSANRSRTKSKKVGQ
jgi:hypothetical protein